MFCMGFNVKYKKSSHTSLQTIMSHRIAFKTGHETKKSTTCLGAGEGRNGVGMGWNM